MGLFYAFVGYNQGEMGRTRRATWDGIEVEAARNVQGERLESNFGVSNID